MPRAPVCRPSPARAPRVALVILAVAGVAGHAARAAEFAFEPGLDTGLAWYDNRTLAQHAPIATWAGTIGAGATVSRHSERGSLRFAPRININRYSSGRLLDTEDIYLQGAVEHDFERVRLALVGDHSDVTSLNSADVESGIFRADVTRTTTSVSPSATLALDAATTARLYGGVTAVSYTGPADGLSDYDYSLAGVAVDRAWSETGSVELAFDVTDFRTTDDASRIFTRGGRITVLRALTPTLRFEGMLGFDVSSVDFLQAVPVLSPAGTAGIETVPAQTGKSGPIYDVSLVRRFERGEARFRYGRQLSPTGNGDQQITTQLGLDARRDWSERLQTRVEYSHHDRRAQAGLSDSLTNTGDFVGGTVAWKLSPHWRIEGRYAWQRLHLDAEEGTDPVDGHTLGVTLRYAGDRRAVTR